MNSSLFPCPSCGFLVFAEPAAYEICDICGWEDDPVQLRHPLMGGGANKRSLALSQEAALKTVPSHVHEFLGLVRDPGWRPLLPQELSTVGSPRSGIEYFDAAGEDDAEEYYYWRRSRDEE